MSKIDIEYLEKLRHKFGYNEITYNMIECVIRFIESRSKSRSIDYNQRNIASIIDFMSDERQSQIFQLIYDEVLDRERDHDRRLNEPEGMTVGIWLVDMMDGVGKNHVWSRNGDPFPGKIEFAHRDETGRIQKLEISDQRVGGNGEIIVFHRSDMKEIYYRPRCVLTNENDYMFTADDRYGVLVTMVWPYRG